MGAGSDRWKKPHHSMADGRAERAVGGEPEKGVGLAGARPRGVAESSMPPVEQRLQGV